MVREMPKPTRHINKFDRVILSVVSGSLSDEDILHQTMKYIGGE